MLTGLQFRTARSGAAQVHDANFQDAFNSHVPPLDHVQLPPAFEAPGTVTPHRPTLAAFSGVGPDWALQFQRMSVNSGPALSVGMRSDLYTTYTAPVAPTVAAPVPATAHSQNQYRSPLPISQATMPIGVAGHTFADPAGSQADFESEMEKWMAANSPAAEAAIDNEMESIARELEMNAPQEAEMPPKFLVTQQPEPEMASQHIQDDGALTEDQNTVENAGELAAAARKIVEVIDTNQTSLKMKNSGFLRLMRNLADGNVVLKDQDFVDEDGSKVDLSSARPSDGTSGSEVLQSHFSLLSRMCRREDSMFYLYVTLTG